MASLLRSLSNVGKIPPCRVPSGFQSHPTSLKEMIRIMNLPKPKIRTLQHRRVHDFSVENAQGLTYAYGNVWFLSSEKNVFKYSIQGTDLYKPAKVKRLKKLHVPDLRDATGLDEDYFDHVGDIDYFDGLIFVPIEHEDKKRVPLLLALSTNLELVGYSWLYGKRKMSIYRDGEADESGYEDDYSAPWCAMNPWNGLLYASNSKMMSSFYAYDVSGFHQVLPDRNRWGRFVQIRFLQDKSFLLWKEDGSPDVLESIQGAAFSRNGRLYVARYHGDGPWYNYIHVYHALTGTRLGVSKEYDFAGIGDEIEGLSIHPSGVIYVAVCDNDWPSTDEFEIHAFKYRTPSDPV